MTVTACLTPSTRVKAFNKKLENDTEMAMSGTRMLHHLWNSVDKMTKEQADDEEAAPPRPHIVLVVVDDMGYHNINAPALFANPEIISPELARLAREGISLSNYCKIVVLSRFVCCPSR